MATDERANGDGGTDRRSILRAMGLAGLVLGSGGLVSAAPGRDPQGERRELLVGAAEDERLADVERRVQDAAAAEANVASQGQGSMAVTHRNEVLSYFAIELPETASDRARTAVKRAMAERPGVEYVEESQTYETQLAPNDPDFGTQYAPQQVNAPAAWNTTTGSDAVTVAVVDTGSQYDHPDLSARYGSDVGRDFADGDDDPYPESSWYSGTQSHGTHVSGCASASTDNGTGVAGVSDSRLLSVRALDESGSGSTADIADGIQWAADQGADIVNLSLGGAQSSTLRNAVNYADSQGTTVIAAAGNDGGAVAYPAAYDVCLAVSAIDPNEAIADFSNRGPNVDVAAPGVNVLSTVPTDGYSELSGTSMASPVAAGVAALGLAVDSSLSPAELRQRVRETAVDVGLPSDQQGAGRVDAANIVGAGDGGGDGDDGGDETAPTAPANLTSPSQSETTVDLQWDAATDEGGSGLANYAVYVDGTQVGQVAAGSTSTTVEGLSSGTSYDCYVTAVDGAGNESAPSNTVTVTTDESASTWW